jgi:Fe-S cluster assembly ATP-binding protein
MLEVKDLAVEVAGKRVLDGVNLTVPEGEVHVLFGPNGAGKSVLFSTILGMSKYKVVEGKIIFKGKDITSKSIDERVKLGIGVAFQNPPPVRGVKLGSILRGYLGQEDPVKFTNKLNVPVEFLERDLNQGFSGGEVKRSEILQVLTQNPDFILLDEPDSGVDVENLKIIGRALNDFLKDKSGLLITHQGHLLRYVKTDFAHILLEGRIVCSCPPADALGVILEKGYRECEECLGRKRLKKH